MIPEPGSGRKPLSVTEFLTRGIHSGQFAPGQRLIEAELTRELSISRGPLREAFNRLAILGLIEVIPNRGATVRRLSLREALDIIEVRAELEALAAALAATRMEDAAIRRQFKAAIKAQPALESGNPIMANLEQNQQFHSAIQQASGNSAILGSELNLQIPLIYQQIGPALGKDLFRPSMAAHKQIAKAILSGKPKRAWNLMHRHVTETGKLLRSLPAELFRPD